MRGGSSAGWAMIHEIFFCCVIPRFPVRMVADRQGQIEEMSSECDEIYTTFPVMVS